MSLTGMLTVNIAIICVITFVLAVLLRRLSFFLENLLFVSEK